ncbi:unnamed protein product [Tuber melanosporum]|uniref:(Perigord truffle) hypothetical protein n=1 Tax=Tuber melanosporum (strain Mel28) TaxID=656061 RepID=D5GM37_TUBMM|nr:uncharacterized protein GSTUM_00010510001 [Tuber melanosporum]CAZ85580.1 unnamed protein product [Tuber melanosporum]
MTTRRWPFLESTLKRGTISHPLSSELSVTCVPRAGSLLSGEDSMRTSSISSLGFSSTGFARLPLGGSCQEFLPGSSAVSSAVLHWEGLLWFARSIIQISKPRSTTWFTRLMSTPWSTARKTLPALASVTLLADLIGGLIHSLAAAGVDGPTRAIAILAPFLLFLGIVLPASAALVRVQASHLPEDIEPIVPFDRTFGKTDDRDLTLEEAWRSMGMHGWKRVARMSVKLAPMTVVLPPILVCGGFFFVRTYAEVP